MNISILSVFPEIYRSFLQTSLIKKAQDQGIFSFSLEDFFSCVKPKERIDAPVVGHGSGMAIRPDVVERAIENQEKKLGKAFKIFFSPQGKKMDQTLLTQLVDIVRKENHLMLISGRYEGIDARVETEYADLTLSIGDYVLMGGDLPAMVFLEGLLRLFPGVVGKKDSVEKETFSGPFFDYPCYTLPAVWRQREIPSVLRSGNHAAIEEWQLNFIAAETTKRRFDWIREQPLNEIQKQMVYKNIPPHYIALLHDQVLLPNGIIGTTSVTSMDIHDIARSAKTYGLREYSIVTPLQDQQKIVKTMLDFWQEGYGIDYNRQRHEAIKHVRIRSSLEEVIDAIELEHGKKPLLISTSARTLMVAYEKFIDYKAQEMIWSLDRPILLIFGTGKGLCEAIINRCDFLLKPIRGLTDFNHLSVRSAVAVILDRWLGLQESADRKISLAK